MAAGDLPQFNRGDQLKADDLNALVQAITDLRNAVQKGGTGGSVQSDNANDPPIDIYKHVFPAKSTGADITGGALSMKWQERTVANGSLTDFTDGRNCSNATEPSAVTGLGEHDGLLIEIGDPPDNQYLWIPNGVFQVWVTQSGGSNGDDGSTTTAAFPTYTYDVYIDSAKTIKIGAALSVLFHRPLQIAVTAGTNGMARISDQTVTLLTVDEYFDDGDCP